MSAKQKLIEELLQLKIAKRDLETLLRHLNFEKIRGKGSHEVWGHKNYPDIHIVIATHTKEMPRYQLKQITHSLKKRELI